MDNDRYEAVIKELDLIALWQLVIAAVDKAKQQEGWQDPQDYAGVLMTLGRTVQGGASLEKGVLHTLIEEAQPCIAVHTRPECVLLSIVHTIPPHTAPQS